MTDKNQADALAQDIRTVDGKNDLDAAELAEKLIELGWAKNDGTDWKSVAQSLQEKIDANKPDPKLKDYAVGESVEVIKNGDWLPGHVQSKQAGLLSVYTQRGPVTVASTHIIRKVTK